MSISIPPLRSQPTSHSSANCASTPSTQKHRVSIGPVVHSQHDEVPIRERNDKRTRKKKRIGCRPIMVPPTPSAMHLDTWLFCRVPQKRTRKRKRGRQIQRIYMYSSRHLIFPSPGLQVGRVGLQHLLHLLHLLQLLLGRIVRDPGALFLIGSFEEASARFRL